MKKLAIITIHKGNIANLEKTLKSVTLQKILPNKHIIITPKLPKLFKNKYRKNYIQFIIGKDKSIYNAMNIGLNLSLNYNVLFLNSGDIFYNKECCKIIKRQIFKHPNKVLIFKVLLKNKNQYFFPKKQYFENKDYMPHPGFIRPPVNKTQKLIKFNESFETISDGLWMKQNLNFYKSIKINKIITVHSLGGISTVPTMKLAIEKYKLNQKGFFLELLKIFLFKLLDKNLYYKNLYKRNFKINDYTKK